MGKHTRTHGTSKYHQPGDSPFRVELPKNASSSAKELYAEVVNKLDQMAQVHGLAIDMLTIAEQVLRSDDLLARPKVKERLLPFFALGALKVNEEPTWHAMIKVIERTRAGLEKDRRVKFSRLTPEENEVKPGTWAFGQVKPWSTKELNATGRLLSAKKKEPRDKWADLVAKPDYEEGASTEEKADYLVYLKKRLADATNQYEAALKADADLAAKKVQHVGDPDIYLGIVKLDMFTFCQRIANKEHELVARSLVHEGTHRHAGTEDHAYMKPDGSGPKPDTPEGHRIKSDYTEKVLKPEDWLGNADSFAFFAYWLWKDKQTGLNFG